MDEYFELLNNSYKLCSFYVAVTTEFRNHHLQMTLVLTRHLDTDIVKAMLRGKANFLSTIHLYFFSHSSIYRKQLYIFYFSDMHNPDIL
jgi:hypothetical protein